MLPFALLTQRKSACPAPNRVHNICFVINFIMGSSSWIEITRKLLQLTHSPFFFGARATFPPLKHFVHIVVWFLGVFCVLFSPRRNLLKCCDALRFEFSCTLLPRLTWDLSRSLDDPLLVKCLPNWCFPGIWCDVSEVCTRQIDRTTSIHLKWTDDLP